MKQTYKGVTQRCKMREQMLAKRKKITAAKSCNYKIKSGYFALTLAGFLAMKSSQPFNPLPNFPITELDW